jgi:plasmid stabilization system protein ParE
MTYSVIRSDVADAEIDAIVFWLTGRSPERGKRWYAGFTKAVATLTAMPTRCPIAAEADYLKVEVRQLRFMDHRILFTLTDSDGDGLNDTVVILHVRHVSRGPMYPQRIED